MASISILTLHNRVRYFSVFLAIIVFGFLGLSFQLLNLPSSSSSPSTSSSSTSSPSTSSSASSSTFHLNLNLNLNNETTYPSSSSRTLLHLSNGSLIPLDLQEYQVILGGQPFRHFRDSLQDDDRSDAHYLRLFYFELLRLAGQNTIIESIDFHSLEDELPSFLINELLGWTRVRSLSTYSKGQPFGKGKGKGYIYHIPSPFFDLETSLDSVFPSFLISSSSSPSSFLRCQQPHIKILATITNDALSPILKKREEGDVHAIERLEFLSKCCDGILVHSTQMSQLVSQQLSPFPPERIHLVWMGGISSVFSQSTIPRTIFSVKENFRFLKEIAPGISRRFLLYVGGEHFSTNFRTLILAFERLNQQRKGKGDKLQLVLVSRNTSENERKEHEEFLRKTIRSTTPDQILFLNLKENSDELLRRLYQGAMFTISPTAEEGMGIPLLEALQSGSIPLSSPSLHTPPNLQFRWNDWEDMASLLNNITQLSRFELLLLQPQLSYSIPPVYFTWRNAALETLKVYEKVASSPSRLETRPQVLGRGSLRIAYFSPWYPAESGISTYSLRYVISLCKIVEERTFSSLFSSNSSLPFPGWPTSVVVDIFILDFDFASSFHERFLPIQFRHCVNFYSHLDFEDENAKWNYQHFFYQLGNHPMHLYMLSILLKYPGIVLLHDVRLVGLYRDYTIKTFPNDPKAQRDYYRQLIVEFEKGFVDISLLPKDIFEKNEPLIESGVFLVRQVLQSATIVFVTSEYAKTICTRYPEVAHKIITQPFGHVLFDDAFFEEREKRQAYNERMTGVVALPIYILGGFNLYSKKLDIILEAAQLVNRRRMQDPSLGIPFFEVKFVGFSFEEFFEQMVAAQRDGLQVSILGRVSEETYLECLKNATLGIQLRTPSNGERSGALSDLMAAGVPVIVTQGRSSADVEQGATLQVPEGQHTVVGLALYLERLLVEVKLRERIGRKAKEYALKNSFDVAAAHYLTYVAAEERKMEMEKVEEEAREIGKTKVGKGKLKVTVKEEKDDPE